MEITISEWKRAKKDQNGRKPKFRDYDALIRKLTRDPNQEQKWTKYEINEIKEYWKEEKEENMSKWGRMEFGDQNDTTWKLIVPCGRMVQSAMRSHGFPRELVEPNWMNHAATWYIFARKILVSVFNLNSYGNQFWTAS